MLMETQVHASASFSHLPLRRSPWREMSPWTVKAHRNETCFSRGSRRSQPPRVPLTSWSWREGRRRVSLQRVALRCEDVEQRWALPVQGGAWNASGQRMDLPRSVLPPSGQSDRHGGRRVQGETRQWDISKWRIWKSEWMLHAFSKMAVITMAQVVT